MVNAQDRWHSMRRDQNLWSVKRVGQNLSTASSNLIVIYQPRMNMENRRKGTARLAGRAVSAAGDRAKKGALESARGEVASFPCGMTESYALFDAIRPAGFDLSSVKRAI